MSGVSFSLGRVVAKFPLLAIGAVIAAVAAFAFNQHDDPATTKTPPTKAELDAFYARVEASTKARADAPALAECQSTVTARTARFSELFEKKKLTEALVALGDCPRLMNDDSLTLLHSDVARRVYLESANSRKAGAVERFSAIQALRTSFPEDADRLEKTRVVLQVQADQEAARVEAARRRREGVSIGMSKADALASSWGRARKVNTTTNAYGIREQWVYQSGGYLYFKDGVLTSVQN